MGVLNDKVRQELCRIVGQMGNSAWDNPSRLEALLRDALGSVGGFNAEIGVLVLAARRQVPQNLLTRGGTPPEITAARLATNLAAQDAIAPDAATWAVGSWASCLHIVLAPGWAGGAGSGTATPTPTTAPTHTLPASQPQPWSKGYWKTPAQVGIRAREQVQGRRTIRQEFRPVSLPTNLGIIETTQAGRVNELARIGLGSLRSMALSPGGALLAVVTSVGVELRASDTLGLVALLLGPANSVAFSETGKVLSVGTPNGTVQLWQLSDGDLLATLSHPHVTNVSHVLFSPDGKLLAAASFLGATSSRWTVVLWDVAARNVASMLGHAPEKVVGIAFSPDSKYVFRALEADAGSVASFAVTSGAAVSQYTTVKASCLAISVDGNLLGVGTTPRNEVAICDATAPSASGGARSVAPLGALGATRLLSGHTGHVTAIAFSPPDPMNPHAQMVLTASEDSTVRQWRVATGTFERSFTQHTSDVISVLYSRDGRFFYTASTDGAIHRYRANDGLTLATLLGHSYKVNSLAFSPDSATLALGCANNTVQLCRVQDGEVTHTMAEHTAEVNCVAFSADGKTLASGSADTTIRLWRVADGTHIRAITHHTTPVRAVAFSRDGAQLASAAPNTNGMIFQVGNGALVRNLTPGGWVWKIENDVAYAPNGQYVVATCRHNSGNIQNYTVLIARATGSDPGVLPIPTHKKSVLCLAFSPDSMFIATGSADKMVRIWRVSDPQNSPPVRVLTEHTDAVSRVAYSPDGRVLASGSADGTVRLWRAYDGMLLRLLEVGRPVLGMAFSPNGNLLATGSVEGVSLWGIDDD